METINKQDFSLGLVTFDVLGFESEEEFNKEILNLMKVRSEFESKSEVNSI